MNIAYGPVRRALTRGCLAAALLLSPGWMAPAMADEKTAVTWRWMPPLHVPVPIDWDPMVEDAMVGYYFGAHPKSQSTGLLEDVQFGTVAIGLERPPRNRDKKEGLEAFLSGFDKMGEDENALSFDRTQEDIVIGGAPAVLLKIRGEVKTPKGGVQAVNINAAVTREPDAEGRHVFVMMGGGRKFYEEHEAVFKAMLERADRTRKPPLEYLREIPVLRGDGAFDHTFGPAADSDGVTAIGDSRHGKVRVFAPDGSLMHEWGGEHEDRKQAPEARFRFPRAMAFGPEGRLYVLSDGFYLSANIQVMERDGRFRRLIALGREALGDQAMSDFTRLWVQQDGRLIVHGRRISDKAAVVAELAPDGTLQRTIVLPDAGHVALMPDGGVVLASDGGDIRSDWIRRFAADGALLGEWWVHGTSGHAYPGADRAYFSVENLDADGAGRIYAYDRMGRAIWIYSADGEFLQVVPKHTLVRNRVGELLATPRGDLLVLDEASSYSAELTTLRWLESGMPADVGEAIAPAMAMSGAAPPDERPPELVALARDGGLTVRALRGFGQLSARHDGTALKLRGLGLDLYAADAPTIDTWLAAHAAQTRALPEDVVEPLQDLVTRLREFEPAPAAPAQAACVCVDLDGDGVHGVMKYGGSMPLTIRANAGDAMACQQMLGQMPECAVGR